jgi:hypothetical protein
VQVNSFEQLLEFISRLEEGRIHYDLKSVRDAVMVCVVSPSEYYEIEFFADAHIEVQTYGPPSLVHTVTLQEITDRVIHAVNG